MHGSRFSTGIDLLSPLNLPTMLHCDSPATGAAQPHWPAPNKRSRPSGSGPGSATAAPFDMLIYAADLMRGPECPDTGLKTRMRTGGKTRRMATKSAPPTPPPESMDEDEELYSPMRFASDLDLDSHLESESDSSSESALDAGAASDEMQVEDSYDADSEDAVDADEDDCSPPRSGPLSPRRYQVRIPSCPLRSSFAPLLTLVLVLFRLVTAFGYS